MESYKLFDGQVMLAYDPHYHAYFINGKKADGVTSALKVIDKSGPLLYWAVNKMCIPYIRENIKPGVVYDEIQLMNIFKEAGLQHNKKRDEAAGIGAMVHSWLERWIKYRINEQFLAPGAADGAKTTQTTLPWPEHAVKPDLPQSKTMQNAIGSFFDWEQWHKPQYLYSEKKVANPKHIYAGTMDFEAYLTPCGRDFCCPGLPQKQELAIGDIKTSNKILHEYRLQTAAYLDARHAETKQKYGGRWCIRVGKELRQGQDGIESVEFEAKRYGPEDQKKDFAAFLSALTLYRRMCELNKDNPFYGR